MFSIFSSFISQHNFNFNIKTMEKEILKINKKNSGKKVSNYGGWQSFNFYNVEKPFVDLFDEIDKIILNIKNKLEITDPIKFQNYWLNINTLGSFNRPHSHSGSIISGVFYITTPPNSGNLIFQQFFPITEYYGLNIKRYNKYNSAEYFVKPTENFCILFPSYLPHYVEPNLNKQNRISISFNYGF